MSPTAPLRFARAFALGAIVVPAATPGAALQSSHESAPAAPQRALERPLRFAILGDFGEDGAPEADVAAMVHGMNPQFIVTVGDNNYPDGEASTIDPNVGKYYQAYIGSYAGTYGPGALENRFFPCPGNHDWHAPGLAPYLAYFTLPGNERYYDVVEGPAHFFLLDSDSDEPDGITADSIQGQWLQAAMAASTSTYKFVLLHHAPFSSSDHGPDTGLQWPFSEWGADAVFAGHDHVYERIARHDVPFFVNGLGGRDAIYPFQDPIGGSRYRFNGDFGAMIGDIFDTHTMFRFLSRSGVVLDSFPVVANDPMVPTELLVPGGATWIYLDNGTYPGATWVDLAYDDSFWGVGPAQLGYDEGDEATLVSYGPDPDNKYITTYFRHEFEVTNPASITTLILELLRDDGAVVYLNGTEVHRVNLPGGPIGSTTLANATVSNDPEDSLYETELDPAHLVPGTNIVAVEIHQASVTSSDISFDLELSVIRDEEVFIPAESTWSYLETGVGPGDGWADIGFDDALWSTGDGPFGYGDGDEQTVISFGPNILDPYRTTYFRHSFNVVDPAAWNGLFMRLQRDAGAVVYLNGKEVARSGMRTGKVEHDTLAGYLWNGSAESDYVQTRLYPANLVAGENVLAVEIHLAFPVGADMSFDLELLGRP